MSEYKPHPLHDGERHVQQKRGSPPQLVEQLPLYIDPDMPGQHAEFYQGLPYISLGTLDARGRPWASVLVTCSQAGNHAGVRVIAPNEVEIAAVTPEQDPFYRALREREDAGADSPALFAGVGVDFTNRRRNKLAGVVGAHGSDEPGQLRLHLKSEQHLGNCPKYITVRTLEPYPRSSQVRFDGYRSVDTKLPAAAKAIVSAASTVFLATKHDAGRDERDMGFNHRGGRPGFVRLYEETSASTAATETFLVLPDYSGNRFYQSLGNVESDGLVGLTFPNFSSGDVLYVTGEAENLYDADAEALMPRVKLLTRVRVTGAVLIEQALSLKLTSDEQLSPYNPPLRLLRAELAENLGVTEHGAGQQDTVATLTETIDHSSTLTTFRFHLSQSVATPLPGGFGIFDFSEIFEHVYRHMDEANPQAVNDDHIRTWTLSSAPTFDGREQRFLPSNFVDITVKRKPGGLVSNYLHSSKAVTLAEQKLSVPFLGSGGDFSCFTPNARNDALDVPAKMLWIAGGAGITPFMSMWDGLVSTAHAAVSEQNITDILLFYAGRDDDVNILRHFQPQGLPRQLRLSIFCFQSLSGPLSSTDESEIESLVQRRMDRSDFSGVADLADREVFICGPMGFMQHTEDMLRSVAGAGLQIHRESYAF